MVQSALLHFSNKFWLACCAPVSPISDLLIHSLHKKHCLGREPKLLEALRQHDAREDSAGIGRCQAVIDKVQRVQRIHEIVSFLQTSGCLSASSLTTQVCSICSCSCEAHMHLSKKNSMSSMPGTMADDAVFQTAACSISYLYWICGQKAALKVPAIWQSNSNLHRAS